MPRTRLRGVAVVQLREGRLRQNARDHAVVVAMRCHVGALETRRGHYTT